MGTMNVHWKREFNPQLVAEKFEGIKQVDETGKVSFGGSFFREFEVSLQSGVELTSGLHNCYLCGIISSGISSAGKSGRITPQRLLAGFERAHRKIVKIPVTRFVLASSVSLSNRTALSSRRMNSCSFTFSPFLPKRFDRSAISSKIRQYQKSTYLLDYLNVRVALTARSPFEAGLNGIEAMDLLRSIWNLASNMGRGMRISFGERRRVNSVELGPIHTVHTPDGQLASEVFFYEPFHSHLQRAHDFRQRWSAVTKFERLLRQDLARHSYRDEIEQCLRRYSHALGELQYDTALLKLWGILETLTGTQQKRHSRRQCHRAAFLFKDFDYHRQLISQLRDDRNRFAHLGRSDEDRGEPQMYLLKRYVEQLLVFHLRNKSRFATIDEAASFLDLPRERSRLRAQRKMIDKALRFRD